MNDNIKTAITAGFINIADILNNIILVTEVENDDKKAARKITYLFKNIDRIFANCYRLDVNKEFEGFIAEYHERTQNIINMLAEFGIRGDQIGTL